MTAERWQQVKNVLEAALLLDSGKQRDYLDRACSSDQSLRREVESLLAANDEVRTSFLQSPPPRLQLQKGARLGDYEIQSLLGAGGMGEVYRARDPRLRRDVAVKVLPSFFSSDKERLRRFEQEAQAAAALNHPNILAVFQMGTFEGAPYLVSELLEGDTLRGQVGKGPMAVRKAIDYGVQIAHGLAAAHEKGIVHRDLKPENLFATKDGRIKILDFGLAKLKQPESTHQHTAPTAGGAATEPGIVMGTAGYMSPEQVRGNDVDHRTDIFSFGAILYELLTGKRAFQKTTSAETMSAILNEEPAPLSQVVAKVPPALQRTVHRCLEKSPELRFQSASDLAFALEALSDSTASPISTTAVGNAPKPSWRAVALSALAVAIVAMLAFWWLMPERVPIVEGMTQLTNDRIAKANLVTDGLRIYFDDDVNGGLFQVAVTGGETGIVPTKPGSNFGLEGITPDLSKLLVHDAGLDPDNPLSLLPLPAGEPRRIDLKTNGTSTAAFFPDGRMVWIRGPTVSVAEKDGSNPRKLTDVPGMGEYPVVSPDASWIRLTVTDDQFHQSIWEMRSDGTGLHQLIKGWPGSLGEQGDAWTPDGEYFLFHSQDTGRSDLWALPERKTLLGKARLPIRLTHGPISFDMVRPSPDGKKLFAIGSTLRGELVRYDAKTGHFTPYLSGMSAIGTTASRDGKWIAYVSYPDHALWRANPDGSGKVQLTFPPMMVFYPQISPDGSKIAFSGLTEAGLRLYVLELSGRTIEMPADFGHAPTWSPDGNSLAFGAIVAGKHFWDEPPFCEIHIIDLRTRKISVIADPSGSRYAPWWPSPHQIIAYGVEDSELHLYDFKTSKWSLLGPANIDNWTPSLDGGSLFLLGDVPGGTAVFRVRAPDFHVETIVKLTDLRLTKEDILGGGENGKWIGIAADGSLVLTRDVGSNEIFALDVKWP